MNRLSRLGLMGMGALLLTPASGFAQDSAIDSGDTTWILVSSAVVMLMTPGLALFYGGMVRRKNVLGTIMHSFVALGVITIQWVLIGYSLSFAEGNAFIGGTGYFGLKGVGGEPAPAASTIPHQAFMVFQMMFAIITPALISGAFAERFKFSAFLIFIFLWSTLVYDPLCHWVWGGGWIAEKLGALDFAGGLVVHISSGIAALAAAILVGKRRDFGKAPMPPHNLTMTLTGTALLWFGWYGFNGGSALASGAGATAAFLVTHIAAGAGALAWLFAEWIRAKRPTALGFASGAIAGLVAITPAAGFVDPLPSIAIGLIAGALCYLAVGLKSKLGYDDSLDVVGIHGVGGIWGAVATGIFVSQASNPGGLLFGDGSIMIPQILSVLAACGYVFVVTFILLKILDLTIGIRVSKSDERTGLDLSQHGEDGYIMQSTDL